MIVENIRAARIGNNVICKEISIQETFVVAAEGVAHTAIAIVVAYSAAFVRTVGNLADPGILLRPAGHATTLILCCAAQGVEDVRTAHVWYIVQVTVSDIRFVVSEDICKAHTSGMYLTDSGAMGI